MSDMTDVAGNTGKNDSDDDSENDDDHSPNDHVRVRGAISLVAEASRDLGGQEE